MRLQVTHDTFYDYAPSVETAQHLAYLRPLDTCYQQLLSHTLNIDPPPAQLTENEDVFGNIRSFFSLDSAHESLRVVAKSVVLTSSRDLPLSLLSWEATQDYFRYQSGRSLDKAAEYVYASPFCPRHPDFADYARPSFLAGGGLLDGAKDLMQRIYTDFTYESESTQINTPAREALAQRKGVCQDFAHIMIACLRALGLPARYVSGYLLTHPAPGMIKLQGSDASHAWVAVYVPDLPEGDRWCDLDPTNNRAGWYSPGEDYVTLGTGRDFADVSPIRGVIHGGASHTLTVGVTVEPLLDIEPMQPLSAFEPISPDGSFQSQFQAQLIRHECY
jgi:transglutaminase-like putative cysteine protease